MTDADSHSGVTVQFCGTCLAALSGMALFFVLLAWLVGGDQFKDSIYGNFDIAVFLAGIAVGVLMTLVARYRRQQP